MPRDADFENDNQDNSLMEREPTPASQSRDVVLEYDFHGRPLRPFIRDGEAWFIAADVCAILEHSNPRVAISRLDDDQKGVSTVYTPGGPQDVGIINESGLYTLIFSSRKPQAKDFRRWVTGTVLPSLRRTAAGEPVGAKPGEVFLRLAAPGRFLVTLTPGKPAHIQRMPLQSVVHHVASNDLEILALALRFIGSWWCRYQNTGAIRIGPTDGFCRDQLELAILNGQILGDEALQAM